MLIDEVRDKLAALTNGKILKVLSLPESCPGFLYRRDGWYGAAIPFKADGPIEEHFSNAMLHTTSLSYNHETFDAIAIECSAEETRYQFASLCAEFLEPGDQEANRKELTESPRKWWKKWCDLLGNSIQEKKPYQILGEMLVLERLLIAGEQADWAGPKGSTRDIVTDTSLVEVKSTLNRYQTQITVSSKYQLDNRTKPLFLVFVRFEPQSGGDSLAKAVDRLVALGCSRSDLLKLLKKQGIVEGNQAYQTGYNLLEMRKYEINEEFPIISDSSFAAGHMPENIVHFVYTIDLTGIPYEAFEN